MKYLVFTFLFLVPILSTAQETTTFKMPDVRDDYCGIHINYQYCKCAFHGDFCDAIGTSESGARSQVMSGFRTWVGDMIETMARNCIESGNSWSAGSRTCTVSNVEERVKVESDTIEEQYNLPDMTGVPDPVKTGYYGKVSTIEREVFVYQWAFKRWVKARPGMPLYQGDFVFTRNGETRLIYNGEYGRDVLSLAPETVLETGRFVEEKPREHPISLLGVLKEGAIEIYNESKVAYEAEEPVPLWYRQLHTPTVAPGVRGSHVVISYDPTTEATTISVNEGVVDFEQSGTSTLAELYPGEQAVVTNTSIATSSIEDWQVITSANQLPSERIDATGDELVHDAPAVPVDDQPTETGPTREELIGDLSDIDEQFKSGSPITWLILVLLLIGAGVWFKRKQNNSDEG